MAALLFSNLPMAYNFYFEIVIEVAEIGSSQEFVRSA